MTTDRSQWRPRRRTFVLAGAALLATGGSWIGWSKRFAIKLLIRMRLARPRPELVESPVGPLTGDEKAALWEISQAVSARWNLPTLTRQELGNVLDLKTERPPSYLVEYRQAVVLYRGLRRGASPADAIKTLLAAPRRHDDHPTAEGRVCAFVIEELINLQLTRGGFQQFGFAKYRGFPGGFGADAYRRAAWPVRRGA